MVRHQGVTPPRPSSPVGALLISAGAVPPQLGRSKVAASPVVWYVKLPYFSQGPITSRKRRRRPYRGGELTHTLVASSVCSLSVGNTVLHTPVGSCGLVSRESVPPFC